MLQRVRQVVAPGRSLPSQTVSGLRHRRDRYRHVIYYIYSTLFTISGREKITTGQPRSTNLDRPNKLII